jgi:hypothetical protein
MRRRRMRRSFMISWPTLKKKLQEKEKNEKELQKQKAETEFQQNII